MVKAVCTYRVKPSLPERLKGLETLAYNLHWTWHQESIELFRRMDRQIWESSGHNPVMLLGSVSQERLKTLSEDEGFLANLERVLSRLQEYMTEETWFEKTYEKAGLPLIAYFSMEFGLTECLPIYSGGLGVLAGDHLKSASDLGVPLVGVGLMYRQGYFQQYLNEEGWQQEIYPENDFYNLPLRLVQEPDGSAITVSVPMADREVHCQIWKVQVGRVPLYLLDTTLPQNQPEDREITFQLYGGDIEMRIRQEIVLGMGGLRALEQLGIKPPVCHMNEGHSAFLAVERTRGCQQKYGISKAEASQLNGCGTVFTTHTPVPAGIDEFPNHLMVKYFGRLFNDDLEDFLRLGRSRPDDPNGPFNMAIMALRFADFANGVSRLHGKVTRRMWHHLWPSIPADEIPIGHVTNGVHYRSWLSNEMSGLFDRYLDPDWAKKPAEQGIWKGIDDIPDEELWRTHERRRERLVAFTRRRLKDQLIRRGSPTSEVAMSEGVLNPEALTIGFARRFATYKRANLLFRDRERLIRLLTNPQFPVQLIFAGKAHPKDGEGKDIIRQIIQIAHDERLRRSIVFLENYDISLARFLTQGCDVWLNTPRRPLEASGTSGMKVCPNGGLNLSTLDGWWDEGYNSKRGWAIGMGEEYENEAFQDEVESRALYEILERDIIPLFYQRGLDGLPRQWMAKVKTSMRELCPIFNTNRMVRDYTERFYVPAMKRWRTMEKDQAQAAKDYAAWRIRILNFWKQVKVRRISNQQPTNVSVGSQIMVNAEIELGELSPNDVKVEIYSGIVDYSGEIKSGKAFPMKSTSERKGKAWEFQGEFNCEGTGLSGFSVRVLPRHDLMANTHDLGLICWADK